MARPDYIQCVTDTHVKNVGKAWCGRTDTNKFFMDADHAAQNGRNKGRLIVCKQCRKAIFKALLNGWG